MNSRVTYIYGLLDGCGNIRYIGKSDNPKKRLGEHIVESKKYRKTHKQRWVCNQIENGEPINIKIIECVDYSKWCEREKYWISQFGLDRLTNYELGGKGGKPKGDWLPFNQARDIVRSLSLKNTNEWKSYIKSHDRNKHIPSCPNSVYKNDGWVGYGDWLETEFIATQNRVYLPFDVSRKIIHKLKLPSQTKWFEYIRENNIDGIPTQPNKVYNERWISWGDWLGTEFIATQNREYLSFSEAKKFIYKLNIKTHRCWREYCKKEKPENIPSNPNVVYKEVWVSWDDWFGRYYLPFEDSKNLVHKLKIKSNKSWRIYVREGKLPKSIPTSPQTFYKNEWVSWYDWLGKG